MKINEIWTIGGDWYCRWRGITYHLSPPRAVGGIWYVIAWLAVLDTEHPTGA